MTSQQFENLVNIGQLKVEPSDRREFNGLLHSGRARLKDARLDVLSNESRFVLSNKSAHTRAISALSWHGYRSDNRYIVFQCLPQTLGVGVEVSRVLSHCHNLRNRGEYEGLLEINAQLIVDLIQASDVVLEAVEQLESGEVVLRDSP
jgi:hypothetical protein